MRPKELQKKLNITADRIKLYKREEVFTPENPPSGNRGTNYTENDLESIRLLEVLTKSGLTCSDIKKMQDGETTLVEAAQHRIKLIEAEIEKKQNAMLMLSALISDNADFETFDTNHYWNYINEKESAGEKFIDIEEMYGYRAVSLIKEVKCPYCGESFKADLEDYIYDESSDERENGMGPDCVYSFDSEECQECPECCKTVRIYGWIREYPLGSYDSEEVYVETIETEED